MKAFIISLVSAALFLACPGNAQSATDSLTSILTPNVVLVVGCAGGFEAVNSCFLSTTGCTNDDQKCGCAKVNKAFDTCFGSSKIDQSQEKCKDTAAVDSGRAEFLKTTVQTCTAAGYPVDGPTNSTSSDARTLQVGAGVALAFLMAQ